VPLVRGRRLKVLEGEWLDRSVVLLSVWPSLEAATDFWHSPEYERLKPLRAGGISLYDVALFAAEK
jgi:uncharacterized protein (DUF1330 family)